MNARTIRPYLFVLAVLAVYAVLAVTNPSLFSVAAYTAIAGTWEMLAVIPPIFVLLGLLDVWIPRATMIRFLGPGSGARGVLISFVLGSAAAGPLYGAFPVAAMLMSKGASFFNVLIMIGAWSTTKIPMFLFEMQALGVPFALTRMALNIPAIIIMAWLIRTVVPKEEVQRIYEHARLAAQKH